MPATDASAAFGFGVSLARCSPELAREAAQHAGCWEHHFRLTHEDGDPAEKRRHGLELRLKLRRRDFKTLLAVRARKADHSGGLEASGVVLGLRRLARQARCHGHRGAFLVDAQAVLAALQKGRSSAGTLRHKTKQAAALALACDWKIRYGYLPSESNPADDPSRGVRTRCCPRMHRRAHPARGAGAPVTMGTKATRALLHARKLARGIQRGHFSDASTSDVSSSFARSCSS